MSFYVLHCLNENIAKKFSNELVVFDSCIKFKTIKKINLSEFRNTHKVDINLLKDDFNFNEASLFISDMDSTLINIECIDEMAGFVGLKDEVSNITEEAMQGKLDFAQSLKKRVSLFKGLSDDVLDKVYKHKLKINNGGEELIDFLRSKNIKTALVSGGFDFFVNKLQQKLALDDVLANKLNFKENIFVGDVDGDIIDAKAKADFLESLCDKYQINIQNTIAIGDGANDLLMMKKAGLSIAYHSKDKVKQYADIIIDYGDLSNVIDIFN